MTVFLMRPFVLLPSAHCRALCGQPRLRRLPGSGPAAAGSVPCPGFPEPREEAPFVCSATIAFLCLFLLRGGGGAAGPRAGLGASARGGCRCCVPQFPCPEGGPWAPAPSWAGRGRPQCGSCPGGSPGSATPATGVPQAAGESRPIAPGRRHRAPGGGGGAGRRHNGTPSPGPAGSLGAAPVLRGALAPTPRSTSGLSVPLPARRTPQPLRGPGRPRSARRLLQPPPPASSPPPSRELSPTLTAGLGLQVKRV